MLVKSSMMRMRLLILTPGGDFERVVDRELLCKERTRGIFSHTEVIRPLTMVLVVSIMINSTSLLLY